jgi:predicted transposase/invertase (TIGR01784 family)
MVQLVVEKRETAIDHTKQLIQKSRQQLADVSKRQKVLELLETILVYKLSNLTRQEIEAMFTLDELKQTRYFQEVAEEAKIKGLLEGRLEGKLEGKLETVPLLLQLGLTVEQIATNLDVDIEAVRKVAQKSVDETPSE